MQQNEKELFLLISKGDEKAFYHLFHMYNKQLVPFILKLTNSKFAAEEIVQEVFVKIWENREKLVEIEVPKAWIIRIVSNQSYNFLRKNAVEGRLFKAVQGRRPEALPTPADLMASKEIAKIIYEGVNQLPPQIKQVYLLNKEKGLSVNEIAVELNVAPQTVKNQLVSAMKKLRTHLNANKLTLMLFIIRWFG